MKLITILLAVATIVPAATTIAQKQTEPQATAPKKESNRSFDGTPLDPFKEGARLRAKELKEKNYKEMKDAAADLADLSQKLNQDVIESGEDVISARIFERAEKIEKLARRIRDKAKAGN